MVKRKSVKRVKEKLSKLIETTDPKEFAELIKNGATVVEIRSAQKSSYQAEAIPKTYVVKK